ncbi:MAG TPA: sulfotransferase [Allosphingosinicella sp.]|jgi:tetratricopeptide (TPR) repeat protein
MAGLTEADAARVAAVQHAHAAGDFEGAERLAETALRDGIAHPLLLGVLASRREQEGRFDEALALLRRLDAALPGNLAIVRGIALLLLRLDRLDEAAAAFGGALAIAPRDADLLAQRGLTLVAVARIGEARRDFEAATAIDPGHVPALDGLAGLALRRGDAAEARRLAEAALARHPGLPTALLTRAGADLADGSATEAEAAARALAANAAADPRDRATAFGLLGDALDAQSRFPEAFAAWREANDLLRSHYRPAFARGAGTLALVRTMAETLAGRRIAPAASGATGPARRHVFLLGFPRSGTTLIEQVLEEHPEIVTMPERDCLAEGSRDWLGDAARLEALLTAPDDALEPARALYWRRVRAEGLEPDGRVFVDKNPFNSFRLPLIARLFPDAIILFATRDPRDVLLSCFRHRFQMSPAAWQLLTLDGAVDLYAATMDLVAACETALGLVLHPAPLEAIVADFDGETRRICDAIGIGWTPALRDFAAHTGARDVATPSGPQLVRGLNARGVGKWRDYAGELAPALPKIAPWIARFAPN